MDNTQWELDKLRAERDTLSRVAEGQAAALRLFAVAAFVLMLVSGACHLIA